MEDQPKENRIAKKRRGKVTKRRGKSAKFIPGEASQPKPEMPFDAPALVERLNLWWLKGKDTYLRPAPSGDEWLPEPSGAVTRLLRLNGVRTEKHGETFTQADQVMQHVHDHRHVGFAGPIAGQKAGVMKLEDGRPVIVTSSFKYIEGVEGECPLHLGLCAALLKTDEIDQAPWLFAWLKTSRAALRAGISRPAPWLVLAGPSNCGKTFMQTAVLTPLLGGRQADPRDWMFDRTQHNADVIGAEHLLMSELPSGLDHDSRANLGEKMKQVAVNRCHRWRGMHQDGYVLPVYWRGSLSVNDSVERLKRLPPLSSDFADKILLLACESRPLPMLTSTDEEWHEFGRALAAERAAFAWFIDSVFQIPEALRQTPNAGRYGFDSFHHPRLVEALFEQETESSLLYLIDNEFFTGEGKRASDGLLPTESWGWAASEKLGELLRDSARFGNQARKLLSFPKACGFYLRKLADKYPRRFQSKHTNRGNLWMIHPAAT